MEAELIAYREEVANIESALQADPNNEELLNLKTEFLELISETEKLLKQEKLSAANAAASVSPPTVAATVAVASPPISSEVSSPASTPGSGLSTPNTASKPDPSKQPIYQPPPPVAAPRQWSVGDRCRALYASDGKYYEATILSIGGSGQAFSVQYKGYESSPPSTVGPEDLKPPHDKSKYHKHNAAGAAGAAGGDGDKGMKKRGPDGAESGAGGAKKKKSGGASEQVQKQMAWQNFAKSGAKKGTKAAPILKKSIFATPDNPEGKVGVVGSGKGMTQFQQRGKHIYDSSNN
ncbi:hypothetical protein BGX21_008878 [Mortierella sp. AD011]|nr:hypothetical protein BGX20_008941 [Mortierella sp. AD010]KAF9397425.1 hypothetical protein BGX21_008878 [Mortierella sp. AD011]